jgi:Mor family transcriptional regulator
VRAAKACLRGPELFKEHAGKTVKELDEEWRMSLKK